MNEADPQAVYARWLQAGTRAAFLLSLAALLVYLSGAVAPFIAPEQLPQLWMLPAGEFERRAGTPEGWHWLAFAGYSDYLNLAGICLFALLSLVCYARVLPAFLRRGERQQAALAALQILVLLAAASGMIPGAR
ncbi:MAG TPA: hypothetical protein VLU41_10085 [Ideonella sp.]|nr:hypothetical protein [Ideonella sp.]